MQTDDTQRVERLEQRTMELQHEDAELKHSLRDVILNTMDLVGEIERGTEDNKGRVDKILGRPIADTDPVDQLLEPKVTS